MLSYHKIPAGGDTVAVAGTIVNYKYMKKQKISIYDKRPKKYMTYPHQQSCLFHVFCPIWQASLTDAPPPTQAGSRDFCGGQSWPDTF